MPKNHDDLKKEMYWKNNLFSRYMLFRYSLALFFFSNIYWIMILLYKQSIFLVIPIIMLILTVIATSEQFRLYGKKQAIIPWTKRTFTAQLIVNALAIIIALMPNQMLVAFPVFAPNLAGISFVIVMQILGMIICVVNLERAKRIEKNADKFYYRFQRSFGDIS